jgi:dephospho-CoA kinase
VEGKEGKLKPTDRVVADRRTRGIISFILSSNFFSEGKELGHKFIICPSGMYSFMIIGLTGSFGAGKGCVANYLVNKKGFAHFSARAFITAEIQKRGLPLNRDTMTEVANDMRKVGGPTYIFKQLVAQAKERGGNAVVESIRAVAEAKYIKEQGGLVLGIDADPKVRYERIVRRGSETDQVSFEEWRRQEIRESNPDDPTKQDIFGALRESDLVIMNSNSIRELEKEVDVFLEDHHD